MASDQVVDAVLAVVFFSMFWLVFWFTWYVSDRYDVENAFRAFSISEKAEWSSRMSSTIHACIVIPGVITCLLEHGWSDESIAFTSPASCRVIFSVSIGYFIQDLICVVYWKLNLWQVFIVHHTVAAIPYIINNFVPGCHSGNYVLALFLIVEVPTLPLNFIGAMDQLGMTRNRKRFIAFVVYYVLWFFTRVLLPIYLLIVLYSVIIPEWFDERSVEDVLVCVIPSSICADIIALFCIYVFFAVLSVDLYNEIRTEKGLKAGEGLGTRDDGELSGAERTPYNILGGGESELEVVDRGGRSSKGKVNGTIERTLSGSGVGVGGAAPGHGAVGSGSGGGSSGRSNGSIISADLHGGSGKAGFDSGKFSHT